VPGIGDQRQRMRGNAENNLNDDVANVQRHPDRECASKTSWRMTVSQTAMLMAVILIRFSMIVVTHCAIL
jgi:hypothetical protein